MVNLFLKALRKDGCFSEYKTQHLTIQVDEKFDSCRFGRSWWAQIKLRAWDEATPDEIAAEFAEAQKFLTRLRADFESKKETTA